MDTRKKIIGLAQAREVMKERHASGSGLTIVTGHFDVLVTVHVRRLQELKRNGSALIVVVADSADPVLTQRARSELVAALAVVDYVLPAAQDDLESLLREFPADEIAREEASDLLRTQELIAHVRRRQQQ